MLRRVLRFLGFATAAAVLGMAACSMWLLSGQRRPGPTVTVSFAALAPLAPGSSLDRARLERALAADARWFVSRWSDRPVAFRREQDERGFHSALNSYILHDRPPAMVRVGLYLDGGSPVFRESTVLEAGAASAELRLLAPNERDKRFGSTVWLRGDGLALELIEEASAPERPWTRHYAEELGEWLQSLQALGPDSDPDRVLAPGSVVRASKADLAIEGSGGVYEAFGHANPGAPGTVFLKVIDAANGQPIEQSGTEAHAERIGWHAATDRQYYFRLRTTLRKPKPQEAVPARFELWFRPDGGAAERRLVSTDHAGIHGWEF